jgi:arylsulfatase
VHGFDEFFGNLYHLNAEEDPENRFYPQDPTFREKFGPRGVLLCKATDRDDPTEQPRWGKLGKQTIEDTGPLTKKRMETIDDETSAAAIDFIKRQVQASTPFFCWFNSTRMHLRTHVRSEHRDKPGLTSRTEYADGMIEHDATIGTILKTLDDLGVTNDTVVLYTTDNGPHQNSWPDAGTTPFRSEKDTNWEGAFRVPALVRWPGHIKPGTVSNEIFAGLDWFPTLLAAAGDTTVSDRLLKGDKFGDAKFQVHLDGYNQLDYLTGKQPKSARTDFAYFNDDGEMIGYRHGDWKAVFREQLARGGFKVWYEPFIDYRIPKLFNLRMDPYERADIVSNQYDDWRVKNAYLMGWLNLKAGAYLETFAQYPPSQPAASFTIKYFEEDVEKKIKASTTKRAA